MCALVTMISLSSNALVVLITERVHLGLIRRCWEILMDILELLKHLDVFLKNVVAAIIAINENLLARGKAGALMSCKYNL